MNLPFRIVTNCHKIVLVFVALFYILTLFKLFIYLTLFLKHCNISLGATIKYWTFCDRSFLISVSPPFTRQ